MPALHVSERTKLVFSRLFVTRGGPAGGDYSTFPDLLKFGQVLANGSLFNTPETGKHFSEGVNTSFRYIPETGLISVVLSNRDPPAGEDIDKYIHDRIPRNK